MVQNSNAATACMPSMPCKGLQQPHQSTQQLYSLCTSQCMPFAACGKLHKSDHQLYTSLMHLSVCTVLHTATQAVSAAAHFAHAPQSTHIAACEWLPLIALANAVCLLAAVGRGAYPWPQLCHWAIALLAQACAQARAGTAQSQDCTATSLYQYA